MSAPFPLPLIFTAWGFRHEGDRWNTGQELADWCNYAGIRTVAVQLGADEHGHTNTEPDDIAPLRTAGIRVAMWGVATPTFAASELLRLGASAADWLPQVEGPSQRDLVLDAAASGLRPAAIVTNYSGAGDTPGEADRLRSVGISAVFVECYNDAGIIEPYVNLDRMLGQGETYGWRADELVATMGTYHGELPDDYIGVEKIGRTFGLYLAEPTNSMQWEDFGDLNTDAPPEPEPPPTPEDDMEPVTDTQGRTAVGFAVQAAAQNWSDDKPKGRLTVARRVCDAGNDDTKWNACRDAVIAALDKAGVPK